MLQRSSGAIGFIEPCLPSPAKTPPAGPGWLHEIKHDGFRILTRRDAKGVRLYTRNGHDFSGRFPQVVAAIAVLPALRSCLIDGEVIVSDDTGLAVFELIRSFRHDHEAVVCAFDLLELDGENLRRLPIEARKAGLAQLLRSRHPVLPSTSTTSATAMSSIDMPASSAARASCRSGSARRTAPADPDTGLRSRIRRRRQCGAKPRRIGGANALDGG